MAAHLFVYTLPPPPSLRLICTRSVVRKEYRGQVLFQKNPLNTFVGVTIGKLFPASKARGDKEEPGCGDVQHQLEQGATFTTLLPCFFVTFPLYHLAILPPCYFATLPPCYFTTLLPCHLNQLQHIHDITDHRWPHAKSPGLLLKGFPLKGRFL